MDSINLEHEVEFMTPLWLPFKKVSLLEIDRRVREAFYAVADRRRGYVKGRHLKTKALKLNGIIPHSATDDQSRFSIPG